MGIQDAQNKYSNDQAITVSAVSTNVVYHGPTGWAKEHGVDAPQLVVAIKEAFASGTSLAIEIQTSTDEAFTTPIVLERSPVFLPADLTVGANLRWRPSLPSSVKNYSRLNYVVVGTFTTGKIEAALTAGRRAGF